MARARVWVLLHSRTGDNNQALALARSLGLPFETKLLTYNGLRSFGLYLGPSLSTLDHSREQLVPPWPDVVIAVGRWSVPVMRWIKRQNPATKTIFLGNPRTDPAHFDLVIATPDYVQPRGANVVRASLPLTLARQLRKAGSPEPAWLGDLPHPRHLLLVGGSVKYWRLSADYLEPILAGLLENARSQGGSVIVGGSPRTPTAFLDAARDRLADLDYARLAPLQLGGIEELLDAADEIIVTGDSMAMIAEAILTRKPVGLLPLELSNKGWRKLGLEPADTGFRSRRRDLRRFWGELWDRGLAGTIAQPRASLGDHSAVPAARLAASFLGLDHAATDYPSATDYLPATVFAGHPRGNSLPIGPGRGPRRWPRMIARVLESPALVRGVVRLGQEDLGAMSLAARDERTPWYVKLIAGAVSLTAMSPIDLTPDFIPIFGHLDDLVLLLLGTWIAVRLIPPPLMAEFKARAVSAQRRAASLGAFAIAVIWFSAGAATAARMLH